MAATEDRRVTDSGIEIAPVYGDGEQPGEFPFTRGPYPDMYRGRPWTIRQYAGFGSAEETNRRFRYLLERGQTGLSVAFDLPTQMGYDSDSPMSVGEVGRTGVPIDSVADMEVLLEGIDLAEASTSMTINATAARRVRPPFRRSPSPWRTRSPMPRRRSPPGWPSTTSPRASPSFSRLTT